MQYNNWEINIIKVNILYENIFRRNIEMRDLIITEITLMACGIHEYELKTFIDTNTLDKLSDKELLNKYREIVEYTVSL